MCVQFCRFYNECQHIVTDGWGQCEYELEEKCPNFYRYATEWGAPCEDCGGYESSSPETSSPMNAQDYAERGFPEESQVSDASATGNLIDAGSDNEENGDDKAVNDNEVVNDSEGASMDDGIDQAKEVART